MVSAPLVLWLLRFPLLAVQQTRAAGCVNASKLAAMRSKGESYSDVIIRLAAVGRDPLNGS